MDDQIVAVYCLCDGVLEALDHYEDPQRTLSDTEVMTTALWPGCTLETPGSRRGSYWGVIWVQEAEQPEEQVPRVELGLVAGNGGKMCSTMHARSILRRPRMLD